MNTGQCIIFPLRVLCFETEELKTEFDADDNEIAMARIKNIKVKQAAEYVEAVNKIASKWGETMMDDMCITLRGNLHRLAKTKCPTSPLEIIESATGSKSGVYFVSGICPMMSCKWMSTRTQPEVKLNLTSHANGV